MAAILFGSIGTIADTSELQRQAFNRAFEEHGLGWRWDRDDYLALLEQSGGEKRIAAYAESVGDEVDARAVHRSKSELFQRSLADAGLAPREGVVETLREGRENGFKIALVTTTSPENIAALIAALQPTVQESDFDLIVDTSSVERAKPDVAAYRFALERLGETAGDCVAIEDNLDGVAAARAAEVSCVAFPGENNAGHAFDAADRRVERLSFSELRTIASDG